LDRSRRVTRDRFVQLFFAVSIRQLLCRLTYVSDLTAIFQRMQQGESKAAEELVPLVYAELRQLAAQKMAREAPGHTLQPTALVHEAWLRLGADAQPAWKNRAHFFAAAAEAMRRILVDTARRKLCLKRGGQLGRVELESIELPLPMAEDQLLALDEALDRLSAVEPRAAEVIKLCFFVGLTQDDAADQLGISVTTTKRLWFYARAWLFREMKQPHELSAPQKYSEPFRPPIAQE
jgi:RNA polymerase sigma factor (TIGR02999 family)